MLKKTITFALAMCMGLQVFAAAPAAPARPMDEGMWLPMFIGRLNHVDMKKKGLKLTAEEIYSVNNNSLKDAIVSFGGFCTGEIISSQGLVLTNHHCGYGAIQGESTVENDILTNGFWAKNPAEEKPIDGLFVRFLNRMEDVSGEVNGKLTGLKMAERAKRASVLMDSLRADISKKEDGRYVEVKSFFDNNEFYAFVYDTYNDVRLVGTPPEAVGKFGGDTDNWMWPRHTGDFSMFRVYMTKDGKAPKGYSADNVPLKPKHHLPVSLSGVKQDDYAMVMGYPGSTDRYLTSYGVETQVNVFNPNFVGLRDVRLKTWKKHMDASPKVRLQYASKYAGLANYWKYFQGQTKAVKRLRTFDKKAAEETAFTAWVNADAARKAEYGEALQLIEQGYKESRDGILASVLYSQGARGIEAVSLASMLEDYAKLAATPEADANRLAAAKARLKPMIEDMFKDYDMATDKDIMAVVMPLYREMAQKNGKLPMPSVYAKVDSEFGGDYAKFAAKAFEGSFLTSQEKVLAFLENPSAQQFDQDLIAQAMKSYKEAYVATVPVAQGGQSKIAEGNRLYVKGTREMNAQLPAKQQRKFYPNANSTMRLTYGQVKDYFSADGVHYSYYTTSKGLLEKEDPNNFEFILPKPVKDAVEAKNFGRYADANGELRVGFITNNDITGGNSGSPVMNGKGELIGLAFDGNWEAMGDKIAFQPDIQRCINVDIRYVLWIIDQVYGAKHIVDEMTLVGGKGAKTKTYEQIIPVKY